MKYSFNDLFNHTKEKAETEAEARDAENQERIKEQKEREARAEKAFNNFLGRYAEYKETKELEKKKELERATAREVKKKADEELKKNYILTDAEKERRRLFLEMLEDKKE